MSAHGDDASGSVVLSVSDGCGNIPSDDLPPRTRPTGAGLGLAIVRGIVEAHHGRGAVQNIPGGCRFDVVLPLAPAAQV